TRLQAPYIEQDKLFSAQRLDKEQFERANFQHCSFVNMSFKDVTISESNFLDCVFVACYFRRANLTGSSFVACKFIDCEFPKVAIRGCNLRYARFSGCTLAFSEVKLSLPQEPNLREELSRNLAIEAASLGLREEARAFRLCQVEAREADLRAAMTGASQWYREHYDGFRRVSAAVALFVSVSNRVLWGYGERATILLRNAAIIAFGVFPTAFLILRDGLARKSGEQIDFGEALAYSLKNFLPTGIESDIVAKGVLVRALSGIEAFIGVIVTALLASYLLRWILDR
ncbi:MAG: pentapeptide repeat-containing protein, partial [Candidatus Acidiferrum sp.]